MPSSDVPHIRTIYFRDGTMRKEPVGFKGPACNAATAPYEAKHGAADKSPTEEMYESPSVGESMRENA